MNAVVVLGAGMQGRAAVYDLCGQEGVERVTVVDTDGAQLAWLEAHLPHAKLTTLHAPLNHLSPEAEPLASARLLLNLLPKALEEAAFELALDSGCAYVSTNYGHGLRARHGEARRAGILALPEMGLDPGIDLVACAHLLQGMETVHRLDSYGTGLPTPAFRNNPLDYKVTWTFAGVLDSYCRPGVLVRGGQAMEVPARDQFRTGAHDVEVTEFGPLEAYVNGDAGAFVRLLGLQGQIREAGRYSLRYPGHRAFWDKVNRLGMLDATPRENLGGLSPRESLQRVVEPVLRLEEGEKDAVYLRVVAEGLTQGKAARRVTEVYDERDLTTGFTAMSRTVGFTAAIAAEMVLSGDIRGTGVLSPVQDVPTGSFLEKLGRRGIQQRTSETPL